MNALLSADAIRSVYAENGMRTFYKGYTPAMLSLSPFIAINFATFDTLKSTWYGDVQLSKKELQQRNPGVILLLGATAGIIAQTFCYPLDTVRRRMQLKGTTYSSTANAFYTIAATEGARGFYKGMAANALKVVPNNALRFAVYEVIKSYISDNDTNTATAPWRKAASSANDARNAMMGDNKGNTTRVLAASHTGTIN
jgi:solute carrier family 25 phosphate transporter 23/24/25/41